MASLASINIRFKADLSEFSSEMQNSLREIDKFGQKMQAVGSQLSGFITLPLLAAGAASIKFASDFEESTNKVDVAFGPAAQAVKDFSKTTLDSFGIASGSALEMASLFGDMGTSMGIPQVAAAKMSTSLVGLAGDLASFKNIGIDQAQTALAGIFTGETESLKRLGVVMTEAALQEYAYAQGIRTKVSEMDQAEKVQLRYNFVLSKTTNAQGDFERTGGGAANQMRIFQEVLKEIATSLGQVILPIFTKIVTKINEWLKSFNSLSEGTKTTIVIVAGLAAAIGPLLIVIGAVASAIPVITAGFAAMGVVTGATLTPVLAIVAALGAVAYVVANNWGPIKKTLVEVANYFVDLYNNSMVFRGAIEYITMSFKNMWAVAKLVFNNLLATVEFVGNNIFNIFKTLGGLIKSVLTFDLNGIKNALSSGFSTIGKDAVAFFRKLSDNTKATANEIGENVTTALKNTMDGRNIPKIVIAKDKVDATAVTDAVAEAVVKGATGKASTDKTPQVKALNNTLKPAGLADVKGAQIGPVDVKVQGEAIEGLADKMLKLQEVGQAVGASVADAFATLTGNIITSLGLAKDGFGGFIGGLVQTITKLIAMMLASSISQSIAGASAAGAATGPAAIFTTPAFIATAVGGVLAAFAAIPKFATGGIVGGSSMYGDKILARVNSGEMIANASQQKVIYGAMNSGSNVQVLIPEIKLRGADIAIAFNRSNEINKRIS